LLRKDKLWLFQKEKNQSQEEISEELIKSFLPLLLSLALSVMSLNLLIGHVSIAALIKGRK